MKADRTTGKVQDHTRDVGGRRPPAQGSGAQESYAEEFARTARRQAAFFREQAERRRREAEQARTFADLSRGEDRAEQTARAARLDTLGRNDDAVADTFESRARRPL